MKYEITRFFRDSSRRDGIKSGLSLAEAQAHCQDKETSSSTATNPRATKLTESAGPWFDGYEKTPTERNK